MDLSLCVTLYAPLSVPLRAHLSAPLFICTTLCALNALVTLAARCVLVVQVVLAALGALVV